MHSSTSSVPTSPGKFGPATPSDAPPKSPSMPPPVGSDAYPTSLYGDGYGGQHNESSAPGVHHEVLQGRVVALTQENTRLRRELATLRTNASGHYQQQHQQQQPPSPYQQQQPQPYQQPYQQQQPQSQYGAPSGQAPAFAPPPSYVATASAAVSSGAPPPPPPLPYGAANGGGAAAGAAPCASVLAPMPPQAPSGDTDQRYNALYADYRRAVQQLHDSGAQRQREAQNFQSALRVSQLEAGRLQSENGALREANGRLAADAGALQSRAAQAARDAGAAMQAHAQAVAALQAAEAAAASAMATAAAATAASAAQASSSSTPAAAAAGAGARPPATAAKHQTKKSSELAADAANNAAMVAHLTRLLEMRDRELASLKGQQGPDAKVPVSVQAAPQMLAVTTQTDAAAPTGGAASPHGSALRRTGSVSTGHSAGPASPMPEGTASGEFTAPRTPTGAHASGVPLPVPGGLTASKPIVVRLFASAPPVFGGGSTASGARSAPLAFAAPIGGPPPLGEVADIAGAASSVGRWCDEPFDASAAPNQAGFDSWARNGRGANGRQSLGSSGTFAGTQNAVQDSPSVLPAPSGPASAWGGGGAPALSALSKSPPAKAAAGGADVSRDVFGQGSPLGRPSQRAEGGAPRPVTGGGAAANGGITREYQHNPYATGRERNGTAEGAAVPRAKATAAATGAPVAQAALKSADANGRASAGAAPVSAAPKRAWGSGIATDK